MSKTPQPHKITDPAEQKVTRQPESGPHPGPFIRSEIFAPLGLKVAPACVAMGVNRPNFVKMLDGRGPLTRDMAYRVEALTGADADLLLGMQALYDRGQDKALREQYRREIKRVELPAAD